MKSKRGGGNMNNNNNMNAVSVLPKYNSYKAVSSKTNFIRAS